MLILTILVVLLVAVTLFALQNADAARIRFLHWELRSLGRGRSRRKARRPVVPRRDETTHVEGTAQ